MNKIQYQEKPDNTKEVYDFIGKDIYDCPNCHGYGEYEGEYGPIGCNLCNSRLIAFHSTTGVVFADWGDWIERTPDGLILIKHPDNKN